MGNDVLLQVTGSSIVFEGVMVNYDEMNVLSNVNLTIRSNEKVAIIGRTGVGKSSLISALIRLIDFDGQISIDGIDIRDLPLSVLRDTVVTVLQEPALFPTAIRNNLNPREKFSDCDIWGALDKIGLGEVVRSLSGGLDHPLTSGVLSTGHRQLLCLARGLLSCKNILLLDEATSALDLQSELQVHRVLCALSATVITVTHRPEVALLYDRVIRIEGGRAE